MPDRRNAHAVSATPPAPPLANSRVAACPASVISVLARIPTRPRPSSPTARKRMMCPRKETASRPSASRSQRASPWVKRSHVPGRSANDGTTKTSDATTAPPAATRTSARRREIRSDGASRAIETEEATPRLSRAGQCTWRWAAMPGAVLATPLSAQRSRATRERCASRQRLPPGAPHHVVPLRRGRAEALEILEIAMRQVSRAEKRASAAPGRLIRMRGASLGGRGVAARHDVPHALIHSLLGVTRNAARRILRAGVLPAFHDRDHRWLLAVPSLGEHRRAEEERPGETGPTVDPVAVSASPRRVGRSVGSTPRFGRDCWPQGQPHPTAYSETWGKNAAAEKDREVAALDAH